MEFFILEPAGGQIFGTKWAYGDKVEPILLGEPRSCPVCGRTLSLLEWLPPHRVKLSSAKPDKWGDFIWVLGALAVSERFQEIYRAEGLTGIEHFYPAMEIVRVGTRKTGDLPEGLPAYSMVKIKWNGANLDDAGSEVIRKDNPLRCTFDRGPVRAYERVVLEPGSWDSSDIFQARGLLAVTIVSERFRDVVKKHGLTNAWFIPAKNYAYREAGGWYVRNSNESDEPTLTSRGKRQPPKTG